MILGKSMSFLRGVFSSFLFYLNITLWMTFSLTTLILPRRYFMSILKNWALFSMKLCRWSAGLDYRITGLEHLPKGGFLVAAKHQSAWETFALIPLFDDPAFILKRELMWFPLFGWLAAKAKMIPIHRGARSKALKMMTAKAREALANGRQIVIFPEGTRKAPDALPDYKWGIAHLYRELDVPVVPIALNSGYFWPRSSVRRFPGIIDMRILPAIQPGLAAKDFLSQLEASIEGNMPAPCYAPQLSSETKQSAKALAEE